jgi:probable rRNA maturation factor
VLAEINIVVEKSFGKLVKREWLRQVAEKVLIAENADSAAEVSLLITGQERVHELNRQYLRKDRPTDVLAFSMQTTSGTAERSPFIAPPDGMKHLGEVIISYPQAVIQAAEHWHPVKKEMALLIIHGILHLLGYDHDVPEAERQMRAREAEILSLIEGEL